MKKRLKGWVNGALEKAFGWKIYSVRAHGRDDVQDIKNTGSEILTIFDVGANIGQSVHKFKAGFPDSKIYSFEPVTRVFEQLKTNVADMTEVELFPCALGAAKGEATIHLGDHETTHSLIEGDRARGSETVPVDTVDSVCHRLGIERVDLLKIDVEGYDLEVLKGSVGLLEEGRIGFVLVECGFTPGDERHVLFDWIRDFLHPFGYRLFGIYDQQPEWSGEPKIRYANVCFSYNQRQGEIS